MSGSGFRGIAKQDGANLPTNLRLARWCVLGIALVVGCSERMPATSDSTLAVGNDDASESTSVRTPATTNSSDITTEQLDEQLDWDSLDEVVKSVIRDGMAQVDSNPDSSENWGQLGKLLLAHDRFAEGALCLEQAAKLDPSNPIWSYLAGIAWKPINPEAALKAFSLASSGHDPMQVAARIHRAKILADQDRLDDAERVLREVFVVDPGNQQALESIARINLWRGKPAECLEGLRSQLKTGNVSREFLLLGAEAARRLGALETADRYRLQAGSMPPSTHHDPWLEDAVALRAGLTTRLKQADQLFLENRIEESIEVLRETLKEYPQSEWARVLLARALIRTRRLGEAEVVLEETLELNPESFEATFRMGVAKMLNGDDMAATEWFERSIELKPSSGVAYKNYATCLAKQEKWNEAAEALQRSVIVQPNYFDGYLALVEFHLGRGNIQLARAALDSARQLHPDAPQLRILANRFDRR